MNGSNIDTSVFIYSKMKSNPKGPGRFVNLLNNLNKESIRISTPLMMTWGAQEGKDQQQLPNGKWTMSMQFPTSEYSTPEQEEFLKSMIELEETIKKAAVEHSVEWFGKQLKEIDDARMNPMLVYPKIAKDSEIRDYTRPPTFKIKIPKWNDSWKPEIYNEEAEPLYVNGKVNSHQSPLDYLQPRTHLMALIECGGLWFANGKLSITWNLKQAVVKAPKPKIEGSCLLAVTPSVQKQMSLLPDASDNDFDAPSTLIDDDDDHIPHALESSAFIAVAAPPAAPAPVAPVEPAPTPVEPAPAAAEPAIVVAPKVVKRVVKKNA